MSVPSPFHTAAAALLPTAPIAVIKRILRMLLDSEAPAAAGPDARTLPTPARSPSPHRRKSTNRTPVDSTWEELRQQARTAMQERGVSYAQLAAAIGCAEGTVRVSLHRRQPASGPVQRGLRAWLKANGPEASEVAAPEPPFRVRARTQRGNGSATGAAAA
jgi:hypothetical protein